MAEKHLKVLIIGMGVVGKTLVKCLTERECEIVAVVGNRNNIGADVGVLAEIGPIGVYLEKKEDLAEIIERTKPDVAIDCTLPELHDIYPHLKICAEHGLNVATTSDRTYFPWATDDGHLADELDAICKEKGVSICAFGIEDINWSTLCTALAANCFRIESITGENYCMQDNWGYEVQKGEGCGMTPEEFRAAFMSSETVERNSYTYALYSIAREMGLHVTKETNTIEPVFSKNGYYCKATGFKVEKGCALGSIRACTLETAEGITLTGKIHIVFAEDGDSAVNSWTIKGEPDMVLIQEDMHGECVTQYDVINRLPDLLNARPGFLTIADLPKPSFRAINNLGAYVK